MRKTILLLTLAIAIPQLAMAWGYIGHKAIAEIAERNLTPKAKANIERYTKGTPLHEYSLWMDEVVSTSPYNKALAGWHASIADVDCTSPKIVRERYRKSRDGVTAMEDFREQLKDYKSLSDSTVLTAIKCIVHIVADFHCPTHMRYVDLHNEGKYPVDFLGNRWDYHAVWDTGIVEAYHPQWNFIKYAEHLNVLSKGDIKKTTKGWAQEWFEDGCRNVRPIIYWVINDGKKIQKLDQKFVDRCGPLAESQMQKAGYRLAKALNIIFEK
ncbi:MAG: S1/P1 nuclease [Alistipes sp.]|nr:S1/P1 nuclease [Alistipes sp.]